MHMAGKRNNKTKPSTASPTSPSSSKKLKREGVKPEKEAASPDPRFVGNPVPEDEARRRWPNRYQSKGKKQQASSKSSDSKDDSDEIISAKCHYLQAEVDGHIIYNLYDDAHVKAEDGEDSYICRIVELFEGVDATLYFTAQWYYRAKDTVIKDAYPLEKKRVFFSEIQNDNPLDCLLEKLKIVRLSLNEDLEKKKKAILSCNYYCDMQYLLPYSTFVNLPPDNRKASSGSLSTISSDSDVNMVCSDDAEVCQNSKNKSEASLLDLYSGCGAMSTGLCLGANMSGLNLVTRWAVDLNKFACESLSFNHPETEVRNESAEDFLSLLKEWEKLCMRFCLVSTGERKLEAYPFDTEDSDENEQDQNDEDEDDDEIFEVEKILQICYGDPKEKDEPGLHFKVKWKNYGPDYDSWEPIQGLGNCREAMEEFVKNGYKSRILPLPGDVDVICGGPPCQGISGFNRFRNINNPLEDEKNKQLIVFMDIVNYLKPKFVLMENVVDILKFAGGFLGRYALGRLIEMNYQTRLGMMAAGAYGLPQFRMRAFLWGAQATEKLPQYPLPTHDVIVRGVVPVEFEGHTVAFDEGSNVELERKLLLEDAISDLPSIENNEHRDEMPYGKGPQTEFQRLIRLRKDEILGCKVVGKSCSLLYDHRPLELNNDDYQRVCRIPKKKGANFRDLPGVRVRPDNKVEWDPEVKRVYLDSGKPLVPDYAMSFVNGSSSKPFARLWWDETVPTVVTRAEPHNQAIVHPTQDRVLSIRENARLQGFPDYYKLFGPIKERYIQVGNAVAVPVARALGYSLSLAFQGSSSSLEPLFKLPEKFPNVLDNISSTSSEEGS
ncbi:hypothetical protein K2173_010856 [Erythroxylum novogranatense]|uniref:DNA (cytosine-5-)-methyltransferase n=1 Tax=Erythroxylum novogranatense TaxID=1862640 RepID=A0AAV8SZV3_9ROSI|nr:hypothetical protein K2173_010856 [Erythroxylum novogranatense]